MPTNPNAGRLARQRAQAAINLSALDEQIINSEPGAAPRIAAALERMSENLAAATGDATRAATANTGRLATLVEQNRPAVEQAAERLMPINLHRIDGNPENNRTENLVSMQGPATVTGGDVRVTGFDPAVAGADVQIDYAPPGSTQVSEDVVMDDLLRQPADVHVLTRIPVNRIIGLPVEPSPDLIESVRTLGVIQPIAVQWLTSVEPSYEIIEGARRVEACRRAGLLMIPAHVYPASSSGFSRAAMTLVANTIRQPNPLREMDAINEMLEQGVTEHAIAEHLHIDRRTIQQRRRLGRLLPPLREALADGRLLPAVADRVARLDDIQQQALATELHERRGRERLIDRRITMADVQNVRGPASRVSGCTIQTMPSIPTVQGYQLLGVGQTHTLYASHNGSDIRVDIVNESNELSPRIMVDGMRATFPMPENAMAVFNEHGVLLYGAARDRYVSETYHLSRMPAHRGQHVIHYSDQEWLLRDVAIREREQAVMAERERIGRDQMSMVLVENGNAIMYGSQRFVNANLAMVAAAAGNPDVRRLTDDRIMFGGREFISGAEIDRRVMGHLGSAVGEITGQTPTLVRPNGTAIIGGVDYVRVDQSERAIAETLRSARDAERSRGNLREQALGIELQTAREQRTASEQRLEVERAARQRVERELQGARTALRQDGVAGPTAAVIPTPQEGETEDWQTVLRHMDRALACVPVAPDEHSEQAYLGIESLMTRVRAIAQVGTEQPTVHEVATSGTRRVTVLAVRGRPMFDSATDPTGIVRYFRRIIDPRGRMGRRYMTREQWGEEQNVELSLARGR